MDFRKKNSVYSLLLVLLLFKVLPISSQVSAPTWSKDKLIEEEFYTIGTQAYLYYINPFMMNAVLYESQRVPYFQYTDGMPFNTWTKVSELANTKNSRTVMANVNTLYASAWFDLRKEPLLLKIPKVGDRYYSIAMMDAYMNNFSILGSRTIGPYGGNFLICTSDYKGIIPKGYTKVLSPTPLIWALQRIAPSNTGKEELAACKIIQDGITIVPLSQVENSNYDPMTYNTKLNLGSPDVSENPLKLFEIANKWMQINRPPIADQAVLSLFARLGLGPDYEFDSNNLTAAQKRGLLRGIEAGKEMVNNYLTNSENIYNGWTISPMDGGNYGTNYLLRAAWTMQSIGALSSDEAMYVTSYVDSDGNSYSGNNNYVLHFEKDEIPQVESFWSLTLYEIPSILLYDNPINRYQMGPQIDTMEFNKDGSLDIYIQNDRPKNKKHFNNWLPSPKGKFIVTLRFYNPKIVMKFIEQKLTPLPGLKKM
jgi:hypothetical protein